MSGRLFRLVVGGIIFFSLAFANVARACPSMNNMVASDVDNHLCELMENEQQARSVPQKKGPKCCHAAAQMPCEGATLATQPPCNMANTVAIAVAASGLMVQPMPPLQEFIFQPPAFPADFTNSQFIYQKTSRLRI